MKRCLAMLLSLALVLTAAVGVTLATEETEGAPVVTAAAAEKNELSFDTLKERMLAGYPSLLALESNIEMIERVDYEELEEDMRDQMNATLAQQAATWSAIGGALTTPAAGAAVLTGTMMEMSLQQQYDAYEEAYESILNGETQKDNEALIWQLENTQNTVVMMGETIYITLLGMDTQAKALERSEAALERTVQEMTLRHQLGQVSDLALREVENGKLQFASGKATLEANEASLRRQLNAFTGAELTAELSLAALPEVTAEQVAAIDVEKDLQRAKEASYELYAAKKTLEDADEAYADVMERYSHHQYKEEHYEYVQGVLAWEAAQHTYRGTVESFELNFRNLCDQVIDYQQVLEASKAALALEESNCALAELKLERGMISRNAYLEAQDTLGKARDSVETAKYNLFTAYNNYCWAVEYGLLNG